MPSQLSPRLRNRLARALQGTLRTARLSAALSQAEMARRVGVGASTYGRLERGEMSPGLSTLRQLSEVLCLSLEALVGPTCAASVRRASRPPRRRRARARPPAPPSRPPRGLSFLPSDPWGLLAMTAPRPRVEVLPLLLVRRGTPLALVVDVG